MQKRAKLATLAGATLILTVLVIAALLPREPMYQGLTMGQWLDHNDARAREALLILGTNNLQLLVKRIDYDHKKDFVGRTVEWLPLRLANIPFVARVGSHRERQCVEAARVLLRIGTNAAPAIPSLAAIVQHGSFDSAHHALIALTYLGEAGMAVIASTALSTNAQLRHQAVFLLVNYPRSTVARPVITNALNDPDPDIRSLARFDVTNQFPYLRPPNVK